MKKIFLSTIIIFIGISSFACPFCGCGVGNFYLGLLPDFKSKFIGVRYQYIHYETKIAGEEGQFSHDYYHTIELWGGVSIGKKWQLLGFIPYQFNHQNTDDGIKNLNGIGDITALANYKLMDKIKMNGGKSNEQQLWIGGGIKIPSGKYRIDPNNPGTELGDVNSQTGTGSVDFLINGSYNLRLGNMGINTTATYKINTVNSEQYKFGDHFNASSFAYYQIHIKQTTLSPNIGVLYQHSEANHFNNEKVELTGGYLVMAAAGAELSLNNKIAMGANVQLPFSQDFAEGQTTAKPRAMVHISFSF